MSWICSREKFLLTVSATASILAFSSIASAQVIISEFLSDDKAGFGEFVELYNAGATAVDLEGYSLADNNATRTFGAGVSIASGEVIVVTETITGLTDPASLYPPVAGTQLFEWTDSDGDPSNDLTGTGSFALGNGGDELKLSDSSATLIDAVAYGSASVPGYPTVPAPDDDLSAIRQNLADQWLSDQSPTPGAVPFLPPSASCADDPCGANEDCDDSGGDIVCTCSAGYVDDGTGTCIESCLTAGCEFLSGTVCDTDTELCVCGDGTTDYGDGTCVTPAAITCDEDNLGYGFLGQAGDETIPNGGCLTDDLADLSDAGLDAVFTAIADGETTLAAPIPIAGAVVAATDAAGGKRQFYLQDSSGTIGTFLDGADQPPFNLRVGQKVSFEVTKVGVFFGNPQITGAQNWSIQSDGNLVAAPTLSTTPGEADAARMIHLAGIAVESRGSDGPCSDGECFRVESAEGASVVVQSTDANFTLGSQVEVVAPLEWRGDLAAARVNTATNPLWASIQAAECQVAGDCATGEDCIDFTCQEIPDECDEVTPCTGTGEVCDLTADPKTCVCDADNLYVDDGTGACIVVECIDAADCPAQGQECDANACACPAGLELNGDGTMCIESLSPHAGSLVISEVLFHGAGRPEAEYVEILNTGSSAIDIGGFQLSDDDDTYVVEAGASIAPGEFVLFAERRSLLELAFGGTDLSSVQVLEWYATDIALTNSENGESVSLRDDSGLLIDAMAYNGAAAPAGFPSLTRDAVGHSPSAGESWVRMNFAHTPSFASDWRVDASTPTGASTPSDLCDSSTPCVAMGTICDTDATPNVCICDATNRYIDDGAGGCEQVECIVADDCPAAGQACTDNACACPAGQIVDNGQCYDPATDECDETTACTGEGEICNVSATPNTCDCDADNLYVDDGAGGCELVECIVDGDCSNSGETCESNACECPAGQIVDNGQCYDPATDECDASNACTGENQTCDESPTPNVCVCAAGFENAGTDGSLVCVPSTTPIQLLITELQPIQPDYEPWVTYGDDAMPTLETDGQFQYVELHNPTDVAWDLSGFRLTKGSLSESAATFALPSGTVIAAGGYLVIAATDDFGMMWNVDGNLVVAQADTADGAALLLRAEGDKLYVYDATTTDDADALDAVAYGDAVEDVFGAGASLDAPAAGYAIARVLTGADYSNTDTAADFATNAVPTPTVANDTVSTTCADGSGTLDPGEVCDPDLSSDVCCTSACVPTADTSIVCRSVAMCALADISCDGLQGGCIVLPTDIAPAGTACDDGNGTADNDVCDEDGICVDGTPIEPVCGDGVCEGDETVANCPADCAGAGPVCGDDVCEGDESFSSCPQDCDPVCGDGVCEGDEDATSCPQDCEDTAPVCGDGVCEGDENANTCADDCDPVCGNGVVEGSEVCDGTEGCSADCMSEATNNGGGGGGGGGGGCSTTTGGGLAGSLALLLGLVAVTRRRRSRR